MPFYMIKQDIITMEVDAMSILPMKYILAAVALTVISRRTLALVCG